MIETKPGREKVILIGLDLGGSQSRPSSEAPRATAEESMEELCTLARSAGAEILEQVIQHLPKAKAATLLGSGKVEEIRALGKMHDADLAIVDYDLSPTQQRNLEKALDLRVIDRTQLILDIFAARARTREGQLQVELAQLNYLLPRLTGRGIEMSRLGGGIGTRGPGETQLETDRRKIQRKIKGIEQGLEQVRSGRSIQRRQRQGVPLATIALVGYTNAGKSTLFNRITGAHVLADAKMFATLDPTVRHVTLPSNRRVLMSDTVGFIRNLPTTLVRAFRATLEEVTEAELLLHVVDVTAPQAAEQTAHVFKVLGEIGAQETPQILVLNKADLLPGGDIEVETVAQRVLSDSGQHEPARAVAVSARTGEGVEQLHALIDKTLLLDPVSHARFRIPVGEGGPLHLLHEHARVLKTEYDNDWCEVEAEVPESIRRRLREYLVEPE